MYSVTAKGNAHNGSSPFDLWVLPLTGNPADRQPQPYLKTEFNEGQGKFSPDVRFVAYRSRYSGQDEIYVQPFPNAASGKWQISQGGGTQARWSRDGKELYYIAPDSKLMAVEVSTNPVFKAGVPKALFQTTILRGAGETSLSRNGTHYDVAPDGKKFLINSRMAETVGATSITVVLNWKALLKK